MKKFSGRIGLLLLGGFFLIGLAASAKLTMATSQAVVEQPATVALTEEEAALIPAVLQAMPLYAPEALPMAGAYYSLQHTNWPPLPGNINQIPSWSLGDGMFLMNDVMVDYVAMEQEYQAEKAELRFMAEAFGLSAEEVGLEPDTPMMNALTFGETDLWLEITNVANGLAFVNLHNATDEVYEIWSRTNLAQTSWDVEMAVWPTNSECMPFTVPVLDRTNLFLWARDWTGIDEDADGLLDWWEWKHFGNFTQTATNDFDGDGIDNGTEYTNGTDPNKIVFWLGITNEYVCTFTIPAALEISNGVPAYIAVLVDSTNFSGGTWQPYAGNPNVYLGTTEGWHEVWVGLRGRPADATQAWEKTKLKLDTSPPRLVITNPTNGTVTAPLIQLQGFCPEALQDISYDITNAAGVLTNQQVLVVNEFFAINTFEVVTNTFQAFDVDLTNGVNVITLHATDLAGNVTTTNFSFTLDYTGHTNPPALQLTWPQNGMLVSGDNFTLDGWVDDPSVNVTAQIIGTNGMTNTVSGFMERTGKFWVDRLPLGGGTNLVTLTVTDGAGNLSGTNIAVIQSALVFTMNPVTPASDLWQPTVNLTGTINDASQAVWVNGVKGHNNGDGTWSASNVPVSPGGTASFTLTAYTTDEQQPDGSYGN